MQGKDIDFSKYGEIYNEINKEKVHKENSRKVELFFSFDVVNSTLYKNVNYSTWAPVLTHLFEQLQYKINEQLSMSQIWRVLGDEIVFIIELKKMDSVYEYVDKIFEILTDFNNELKIGRLYEKLCESTDLDLVNLKSSNVISLQSAAWVAIINDNIKDLKEYDNVWKTYEIKPGYLLNEFLGNDIDAGFRIKNETRSRRLTISFELACLLSEKTKQLSNLNIVSYKRMKGIWKNRLYPIIWYHNPTICNKIPFEESFCYDEITDDVADIFCSQNDILYLKDGCHINKNMYMDVNYALNKILKDNNLEHKIKEIRELILNSSGDQRSFLDENLVQELHCVALCFDCVSKKVLILKRSKNRKKMAGQWEFGCVKSRFNKNFSENLRDEYLRILNVDITLMMDESRQDTQPIPLAIYEIKNSQGQIDKGIIVVAKIGDCSMVKIDNSLYDEYKFISKDEIHIYEKDAVNDFRDTIEKGFAKMEEIGWEIQA